MEINTVHAIEALRAVVAEAGADHTYQPPPGAPTDTCVYVWETNGQLQPICIVGKALDYLGIPLELMGQPERINAQTIGGLIAHLRQHGYDFTMGALCTLRAAQVAQDAAIQDAAIQDAATGESPPPTWGVALQYAEAQAAKWANRDLPLNPNA